MSQSWLKSCKRSVPFKGSLILMANHLSFLSLKRHLLFDAITKTSIVCRRSLWIRLTYLAAIGKARSDYKRSSATTEECRGSWSRSTEGTVSKFLSHSYEEYQYLQQNKYLYTSCPYVRFLSAMNGDTIMASEQN
jgi:hypothetical protein